MGAGLFPYLLFVAKLAATGIPCLCVKMRHVSMQLTHSIPTATEVAADVVVALDTLGVEKVMGGGWEVGVGRYINCSVHHLCVHHQRDTALAPSIQVCVVAHSYGTFVAAVLAQHYPHRLHSICLVDPVCLGVFLPNLLQNFLYRWV